MCGAWHVEADGVHCAECGDERVADVDHGRSQFLERVGDVDPTHASGGEPVEHRGQRGVIVGALLVELVADPTAAQLAERHVQHRRHRPTDPAADQPQVHSDRQARTTRCFGSDVRSGTRETLPGPRCVLSNAPRRAPAERDAYAAVMTTTLAVRPTTDLDRARADLDAVGLCMISDALDPAELVEVRSRLYEAADEDRAAGRAYVYDNDEANQRVWALLKRGRVSSGSPLTRLR